MIRRFLNSRGVRKMRRNRPAMLALAVIGLYVALGLWIVGTQLIHDLGRRTGSWSLDGRPVLGALLVEETANRMGAGTTPGFGRFESQPPDRRTDQAVTLLVQVDNAIDGLATAADDPTDPAAAEAAVRDDAAMGERRLAEVPRDELVALRAEAEDILMRQDALKRELFELEGLLVTVEELEAAAAEAASAAADERADAVEALAFSLEEMSYAVEDALAAATADTAELPEAVSADAFFDASDALLEDGAPEDATAASLLAEVRPALDGLRTLVEARRPVIEAANAALVLELEDVVWRLYPMPDGIGGFMYRLRLMAGTDRQGRSILVRGLYSAKIALQVGFVTAFIAVIFGSLLGAAAAFYGGWVDHAVIWLYSTFSSIPNLVLLVVLAFMFTGTAVDGTLIPLYAAFCLTFWIGPCRVIRGEALKIKELEYVQAATAIGLPRFTILWKHVLPNTAHLMFINFSLLFIGAIKGEVILTFLGLGLKNGASWGIMIAQSASEVVNGDFWQIGTATFLMFVLVLAFNVLTDAMQDAFDPKHVG